jgi:C4-dicarboxylate-specific signal transduction histidine kinase
LQLLYRQPIRRQLLAAAAALLVPLTIVALWSGALTRQEREAEVGAVAASAAAVTAAHLEQYVAGFDAMASALARHPAVRALDAEAVDPLFADLAAEHPLLTDIVLVAPDGSSRGGYPDLPRRSVAQTWVASAGDTGLARVTALPSGEGRERAVVLIAHPVRDGEGQVVGALGIGIDLSAFRSVFDRIPMPGGSVATLEDVSGRVLAEMSASDPPDGDRIEAADSSRVAIATGADGVERLYAQAAVSQGPWVLRLGIPRSAVAARLAPLRTRTFAIAGSAALAVLLLGLVVAWQTALHLNRLRTAAQRIAKGDLSPPQRLTAPNLELAQLQDAFVVMAGNLQEARDALDHQMRQERRMNEVVQSLQRQVVRQERLAAVGVLVSGVAHELNNPLQAILGTAELLERQTELGPRALEEIRFVKTQSGRAREIIRNLSRFSNQQTGPPTNVDLRDVVSEVVQLRRRDLDTSNIALDIQLQPVRKVHANFTELEQVALNFVINAQQAIEAAGTAKGRILIRLFDSGRRVRLEVHDNGPGVRPEDESKLFQPFFTTKPVGTGTGLGLSVSYGIIDSYGGSIGYFCNEWKGATFYFELPAAEPAPHVQ